MTRSMTRGDARGARMRVGAAIALCVAASRAAASEAEPLRSVTSRFERPAASSARTLAPRGRGMTASSSDAPTQAHLAPARAGAVTVTWTTRRALDEGEAVEYVDERGRGRRAVVSSASYATQLCVGSPNALHPRMGATPAIDPNALVTLANTSAWADADASNYRVVRTMEDVIPSAFWTNAPWDKAACLDYSNPDAMYQSPIVHTATMTGLKSNEVYSYTLPRGNGETRTFRAPKASTHKGREATKIAVVGDTGQTDVTREVFTHVKEQLSDSDVIVHTGDLSYADGFAPRWDSFGELTEFVLSELPMLNVPGNHDFVQNGMDLTSYMARYPTPHESSKSPSQLFWSYEVGQAHIIGLNSYANTEIGMFDGADAPQTAWLKQDLARINREYTPWVIVVFHAPWYNSNRGHYKEAERMRKALEQMLFDAGVDVILNGHVHAYERSHPVFQYNVNPCGPVHLVVGDGGNYEGPYGHEWMEPQPAYSAFREGSFGAGSLVIHNETTATWEWRRTTCVANTTSDESYFAKTGDPATCRSIPDISADAMKPVDVAILTRNVDVCPNKGVGSATRSSEAETSSAPDSSNSASLYTAIIFLIILWIGTSVALIRTLKTLREVRARMYRSPALLADDEFDNDEMWESGTVGMKNFSSSQNL